MIGRRPVLARLFFVTVLASGCTGGDDGDGGGSQETLDGMLETIRADAGLPGLAAVVVDGDAEVLARGAVGVRRLGDDETVRIDDRWHLGSCTKAMTATLYATAVEDGDFSWDTTLAAAFPTVAVHASYASVTLRQVLGNRGGLPGAMPASYAELAQPDHINDPLPEQRAWFAEQVLSAPASGTPGTYEYSNTGFLLAGAALEAATGESWETLMQDRLFDPLGMASCGFGAPGKGGDDQSEPWGHDSTDDPVDPDLIISDNLPAIGPAGTVHCSITDWGKFAAEHIRGARGESTVLTEDSYTVLHTSLGDDYALGWGVVARTWANGDALTHSGSNTLWMSVVWAAPEIDRAFLAATNTASPTNDVAVALDDVIGEMISLDL